MPESLTAAVGWSEYPQAQLAGKEAAARALRHLAPKAPSLAIVFASSWYHQPSLLQGIRETLGPVPTVGESTAGEIVAEGPVSRSCAVLLLAADAPICSIGMAEGADVTPREAGQQAAFAATRDFLTSPRTGWVIFGDGLLTNSAEVVRGMQESLGTSALIVGGMAGDDLRFHQTYQYWNDRALSRAVVGVLFGGPVKIGVGLEHGFAPIGKPRRITRARANVLYELDRCPAASVYEEYLGTEVVQRMRRAELTPRGIAYPLGVQPAGSNRWLLRNVVALDEEGSLSCSGDVLEGSWLQLMLGNKELVLEAAVRAARSAVRSLSRVACVVVFDAAGRRRLLGSMYAAKEIAAIREVIGASIPLAGCYTYGEQAPFEETAPERTALHTDAVLVVALGT